MKFLIATLLFVGSTAFAGDGGYTNVTCTSDSGRTLLSLFNDNYSGSEQPSTIRLIIDGQMVEYKSSAEVYDQTTGQWVPANPNAPVIQWSETGVSVTLAGKNVLKVDVKLAYSNKATSATIQKDFADPRKGTEFEYYITANSPITLKCKEYYQGP